MEMSESDQKFLDQVTDAGMSLADLRAYNKDRSLGDPISPSEWMKAKDLPEADRERAKIVRITEANKKAGLDEYLKDKFHTPGKGMPEPHMSPASQMKRLTSKK